MSIPAQAAAPMLSLQFPTARPYLVGVLTVAMTHPEAALVWANHIMKLEDFKDTWTFDEREWDALVWDIAVRPLPHRIDIFTVMRGLTKVFDARYSISLAARQAVLRSLYEQHMPTTVLYLLPHVTSQIIQLAVYDQVIY